MKIYSLKTHQILPLSLKEAWAFFSAPENLQKITPPHMKFQILYTSGGNKMYPGQIIRYRVNVLPGVPLHWVTEIKHVLEYRYFVDEQRFGPYAMWHHQHHFKEVTEGVEMIDELNYAMPFGIFGRLANRLFVDKQVKSIFAYRRSVLETRFSQPKTVIT